MAYSLSPWLKPRFFITGTNRPLAGGLMYTYKAGTTDNATTYSDDAGTPNTNPIVLDSDGQCDLFLDDAVSYRIILKNSAGVTQFDKDRIASLGSTQVQSFNSIAALRLRSGTTIANAAKTLGYYSAGDGGGNSFYWDGTSTATDNAGTVIKPTAVSGAGRWLATDSANVNVLQFGAKGDGVTDDTLKFLSAAAYCSAGNKILKISGDILLKKTTVPVYSLISTYYVAGCSMVGEPNSRLTIEGKLGFDLSNVYDTRVENVNVVTLNRESTESDLEATAPALFSSRYGTKNIAVYSNIKVANTLTDSTGTYRVGPVISEYGASIFNVRDVHVNGVTVAVNASTCATCFIQNIYTTNAQTGVVLTAPTSFSVSCVRLINTSVQYEHWVARTATPARAVNGMGAVLIESGGVGSIEDVYTEWPIERSVYAQAIELLLSDCYTLNGEGYKAVGYSRTTVLQACIISNCHVRLDDLYFVGTTRFRPSAFITYWSKNVYLTDCTATNSSNSNFNLECFLSVGRNAHTVKNIKITGCQADNANGLVYISLFTSTTAQLTAIDPTQDFYVVDGITIRNTHIKKSQTPRNGTLIVQFDDFASTDARATYAVKNVSLYNNVIEYDAGGTRDTWTFDVRYVNTAKSINTAVNMAVSGSFFDAAITQPYASIYLDEPNLKSDAVAGIVPRLGNLNVLEGSKLKFTSTFGGDIVSTLDITAVVTGALSSGHRKANIRGKGYYFWDGTMNCGISMCASGLQYFGRAVSGAKTDQVGTPPVGITVGASNIEVRGDLSPTIYYDMTLTLV